MTILEKSKVFDKLEISDTELARFRQYKDNYDISDILFIKNNQKYKIVIEYDVNHLSHLFGKEIEKTELFYSLKVGNRYIIKRGRKNDIKVWLRHNLEVKGAE